MRTSPLMIDKRLMMAAAGRAEAAAAMAKPLGTMQAVPSPTSAKPAAQTANEGDRTTTSRPAVAVASDRRTRRSSPTAARNRSPPVMRTKPWTKANAVAPMPAKAASSGAWPTSACAENMADAVSLAIDAPTISPSATNAPPGLNQVEPSPMGCVAPRFGVPRMTATAAIKVTPMPAKVVAAMPNFTER